MNNPKPLTEQQKYDLQIQAELDHREEFLQRRSEERIDRFRRLFYDR